MGQIKSKINKHADHIHDVPELYQYLTSIKNDLINIHSVWMQRPSANHGTNTSLLIDVPYFVKYGIDRYYNSLRLKKIIKKYNLSELAIPDKYIYTFTESQPTNENSVVICQQITGPSGKEFKLSEIQVQQLYTFVTKGQYYYPHRLNIVRSDQDGKIYIIDTGYPDVIPENEAKMLRLHYILSGKGIGDKYNDPNLIINDPTTILELSLHNNDSFSVSARKWLRDKLQERERERIKLLKKLYDHTLQLNLSDSLVLDERFLEYDRELYRPL